ncbi:hypothetical protein TNCV_1333731 [Trichonephila clavipes]|nr:hypothetical protein TNCV_1333731 [Trichonephila clavipes]
MQQVTVTRIIRSSGRVRHSTSYTDGRKIVGRRQTNPLYWRCQLKRRGSVNEIYHGSHQRLIHRRFQAVSEEILGIEVRGVCRPSNRSAVSNPPPGICSIKEVPHRNSKNVLVRHHV